MIEISNKAKASKSVSISKYFNKYEQETIFLATDYRYMAVSDIANCYPSIYTHSIEWAIEGKEIAKKNKNKKKIESQKLGAKIDCLIRHMQYGQTNGLPEGNKVSEFLAEFILVYADNEIEKILEEQNVQDYKILRYRDDYRIFSNNKDDLLIILNCLTKILQQLGLKIHSDKTKITDNVLNNNLKSDKVFELFYDIKLNKSIQKDLFVIWKMNELYPNSGRIGILLQKFYRRHIVKMKHRIKCYNQVMSYIIDILVKSPKNYGICASIISNLLIFDVKNQKMWLKKISNKIKFKPNTEYWEVWFQRLLIGLGINDYNYESKICKSIQDSKNYVWNFDWLKKDMSKIMNLVIDKKKMSRLNGKIPMILFELVNEYE